MIPFFSYKMSSKRGIWKWEDFFTLGFICSAPGRSIYHYSQKKLSPSCSPCPPWLPTKYWKKCYKCLEKFYQRCGAHFQEHNLLEKACRNQILNSIQSNDQQNRKLVFVLSISKQVFIRKLTFTPSFPHCY